MIPGKPMGGGHFFSHSRELNGVGFLATQSVNMLQSSSLKDSWRAVWSNLNTKIFMCLAGETLKEASKLGGQCDWYVTGHGTSRSRDGAGSGRDRPLRSAGRSLRRPSPSCSAAANVSCSAPSTVG